jgi:hypothetical protein
VSTRSFSFFLFVILNGVLFLRPTELVEPLREVPLYAITLLCCLAVSAPVLLEQLTTRSLRTNPTTVCVLGLLVAMVLSHLSHFRLGESISGAWVFFQIVVYYLLLVGVLDTPLRLRLFLFWLMIFILGHTGLALLHYHGIIDNPALAAVKENIFDLDSGEILGVYKRLSGAGIFANPNDLSRFLVVGIVVSLYFVDGGAPALLRPVWFGAIAVFVHALLLTQSRGGFIGLVVTLMVLFHARFGTRKSMLLAAPMLAVLAVVFGSSRQTDLSTSGGTGQQRIQLWSNGLDALRSSPLFGHGMFTYPEIASGYVAHNSFVEAYVELGFFGGTLFVGALYCALRMCFLLGNPAREGSNPELFRVRPYVLAILAGYSAGMLSSARCYIITTYSLLGLVVVYTHLAKADVWLPSFRVTRRLAVQIILISLLVLATIQVYVMSTVQYGTKI